MSVSMQLHYHRNFQKRTIQRYLYSPPDRTERSVPLIMGFETQSFVCLIANTPLWQKRREVRKVGGMTEHCKSNAPAPLVAQEE